MPGAILASGGVPEHLLVREVLHCCQDIGGGKYVRWRDGAAGDADGGGFACAPDSDASPAQRQLVAQVAELGWLLRKIKELSAHCAASGSVVHEALAAAAAHELSSYYRLVAILEAEAQGRGGAGAAGAGPLTLRRLATWLAEPAARLRVVAACLEAALPEAGGAAVNALYALAKHGDPLVRGAAAPLLEGACAPYFRAVARWVLEGSLEGAPAGFFVARRGAPAGADAPRPAALWRDAFALDAAAQPRFVSDDLACAVLVAGRTVHFLREACGDAEWAAGLRAGSAEGLDAAGGTYQRLRWLEAAVADVRRAVDARLLRDVVLGRERLAARLGAVRRFVLLGQGDFARTLLDLAGPELGRPARELSRHALQGHLDAALRACGADGGGGAGGAPGALRAELRRALEGDRGWDVFSVRYDPGDGPAAAVLSPKALDEYARVSRLLWAVKQVDAAAARAWADLGAAGRALAALRALEREHGVDAGGAPASVPPLLRYLHARRAEMAQFVAKLQTHVEHAVLAPAWARLDAALAAAPDLDAAIAVHEGALTEILAGTFLDGAGADGGAADVQGALRAALRSVLDVHGPIRRLSGALEAAVAERKAYLARASASEAAGAWSEEALSSPEAPAPPALLAEVRSGAWRVHSAFDRHLRAFVAALPPHSHLDLRALFSRPGAAAAGYE
jgi:gamma-tubulin complex component 3